MSFNQNYLLLSNDIDVNCLIVSNKKYYICLVVSNKRRLWNSFFINIILIGKTHRM